MLPDYITKSVPNPASNRGPWYANTAPAYAGIFLWFVFYQGLAAGTIDRAPLGVCIAAIAVAGLLCYGLFYYVPAMLGMKTGYPLYVVGSSTFGTAGGYLMPGLLMGLLQIGWFAVGTYYSTKLILQAIGSTAEAGSMTFSIVAVLWGASMGLIGAAGIQYVAKVSQILNFIPLFMILAVFFQTSGGIAKYTPTQPADSFAAATTLIAAIIVFFATAGAAGVDFGLNSRDEGDVKMGGLVGVGLSAVIAAGIPLLSVAGAKGLNPALTSFDYTEVIKSMGGAVATAMFILFTVASIVPACFCAFIAGNSFNTMIPSVPRIGSTLAGVAVAVALAITGAAADLGKVFSVVGASFGPIVGAMVADYILSGKKWAGPREGVNLAGYGAWGVGFLVGCIPFDFMPLSPEIKRLAQPAVVYSFITGFIVYMALAKAGLEPKTVPMTKTAAA